MKKFLIVILLLNNLIFIFSCSSYKKITNNTIQKNKLTSPFDSSFNKILFKSKIYFYKKYYTGLLFIKQTSVADYRIVFISEIGKKIFDFELNKNNFTVKYILPVINKKILIKTLKKDFSLMLLSNISSNKTTEFKNDSLIMYKFKNLYGKNFIYYKNNNLILLENANKIRKIISISYKNYKNNFPNTINIKHKNIKLRLNLNTIKQNVN